ncbi:MAG TPA: winged helix DNA-binding domain-containing protein [Vicinamibacterales bacterium]|nr:winged helix DNA-binding domain-containing protein [Vicinamibacterales bacterium]
MNIPLQRLNNQHITRPFRGRIEDLVAYLGAVQAQEYPFAKWGLALRLGDKTTAADVEQAFDEGRILRTHVMRPTWHFVAAADIAWMLELTAPRVHLTVASYLRSQGLDVRLVRRAVSIIERALEGGHHLTRAELAARLARQRIALTPLHLGFVLLYAELERVICSGPRRGRQSTYALLAERAQPAPRLAGDEALAELARRFFSSHGPATVRDFVWWSGLKTSDARRGLDIIRASSFDDDGLTYWSARARGSATGRMSVHLLPIYDEYLVAYRDRVAVPHAWDARAFRHTLVVDGQVAGTWRTQATVPAATLEVTPLGRLSSIERRGVESSATRYAAFLGSTVTLRIR